MALLLLVAGYGTKRSTAMGARDHREFAAAIVRATNRRQRRPNGGTETGDHAQIRCFVVDMGGSIGIALSGQSVPCAVISGVSVCELFYCRATAPIRCRKPPPGTAPLDRAAGDHTRGGREFNAYDDGPGTPRVAA